MPTVYVLSRNIKKISEFLSEKFRFMVVKFSVHMNRHVFVMKTFSFRIKRQAENAFPKDVERTTIKKFSYLSSPNVVV